MKHKQRRLFDRLKKKFQLTIFNESTLESLFSLRVSWLDGILLFLSIFVILFFLSFFLIRYTPVGAFMPPYMDVSVRNRLVEHAYKVDSLTGVVNKQTAYIDVVKGIMNYTDGHGADGVLFCAATSSSDCLSDVFAMTRKKGRVVMVGVWGDQLKREDIYNKEIDFLISTSYGPGRYDENYEKRGLDYPYAYIRWTEQRRRGRA